MKFIMYLENIVKDLNHLKKDALYFEIQDLPCNNNSSIQYHILYVRFKWLWVSNYRCDKTYFSTLFE